LSLPLASLVMEHDQYRSAAPRNAMSVDVEEHFQVAAFEQQIGRRSWEDHPSRVADNTHRVLDLFAEHGVKATFFVLGWVAERHPALVSRIVGAGHELASHGYDHTRVICMDHRKFREDVVSTKAILEDTGGIRVNGYRAPSYSIGASNLWALDVLQETGHIYSSSIYPIRHDLYGMPEAPRFAFRLRPGAILELPVTTVEWMGAKLPAGGGGYFRLLPYGLYSRALRRVNGHDRQPAIFYFHPWEVDPRQPRIAGASIRSRFRHYTNLDSMTGRLARLLCDFQWGRMDEVFNVG
jgi:polysaccharide deacetylase family protein (PEP-CTERM system associated)